MISEVFFGHFEPVPGFVTLEYFSAQTISIRLKKYGQTNVERRISKYIECFPLSYHPLYNAFIIIFQVIETKLQRKALNSHDFKTHDDVSSKIKELKLELYRFFTKRCASYIDNFDDLDDLLFGQ